MQPKEIPPAYSEINKITTNLTLIRKTIKDYTTRPSNNTDVFQDLKDAEYNIDIIIEEIEKLNNSNIQLRDCIVEYQSVNYLNNQLIDKLNKTIADLNIKVYDLEAEIALNSNENPVF